MGNCQADMGWYGRFDVGMTSSRLVWVDMSGGRSV